MVDLLWYIRDNKTLGLKYYAGMNYAPVSYLLIQASIKTENQFMDFLILVVNIVQTLSEVQEHIIYFIKVVQLTMAHMFQDQLLNKLQKVITMENALQECL